MKKLTLLYLLSMIISYLLVSFVKLDLNITNWSEDERTGMILISAFIDPIILWFFKEFKNETNI